MNVCMRVWVVCVCACVCEKMACLCARSCLDKRVHYTCMCVFVCAKTFLCECASVFIGGKEIM